MADAEAEWDVVETGRRSKWRSRVGAVLVIGTMAVAGGLLVETGRRTEAQAAEATYTRTASPAAAVLGG